MHKTSLLVFSLLLVAASTTGNAAPQRAGDFALIDHNGNIHQLSRYRHKDAVVLVSHANYCPPAPHVTAQLQGLRNRWEDKGIAFLMIDGAGDDVAEIRTTAKAQRMDLPVLVDPSQMIAKTLGLTKSGEVVALNPDDFSVIYRGPIDQKLNAALQDFSAGRKNATEVVPATGCDLHVSHTSLASNSIPDYTSDIAPIIIENCVECHRPGGIGPFAMNSHLMLQGWSPMIRETLLTRRMPPMQVDPNVGHFSNANYLSPADMRTLITWIDAGAPRGTSSEDPLTSVQQVDMRAWQLGEPDHVVKMPANEVPATGALEYMNVDVDLPFEEDKYVRAIQFIPGDPTVLHHLLTFVTESDENPEGEQTAQHLTAHRLLEGYVPGKVTAMEFPKDTGVFIPKGHKLSMQFHYTTNGRATVDETRLGLYFHDEKPRHQNLTRAVSGRFVIPPHAIAHKAHAEHVFEEAVNITGLRAHMHFRGRDMKFSAQYPDGTIEDLLNEVNYSYAWQPTYLLSEPKYLPAGTKVHVTGTFDNSEYNPANPDPDKEVTFGLQSWDEMFIGYWSYYAESD